MNLPTLYKKDSKGKIQYWSISTCTCPTNTGARDIVVTHGKEGGKAQTTVDTVTDGKNVGKANETSAYEQADLEAKAKWTKQIERKGYVQNRDDLDKDLRAGAEPMLAHRYDKYPDKIDFPCFIQPKLDGHRCIAIIRNGKCELYSRQRQLITGVPHINKFLVGYLNCFMAEVVQSSEGIILDGELYNHELKHEFEELTGYIRSQEPKDGHEKVQYHVYDVVQEVPFTNRLANLTECIGAHLQEDTPLKIVRTDAVVDEDTALAVFREFRNQGYEGAILRNSDGIYEGKRSYNLQKVKEFDDSEYQIVDVKEGRGKMKGHAIFTCSVGEETFDVKMKGSMEKLQEIFQTADQYIGKHLTVMYQGVTKNGIPRFPVGLRIREDV